MNALRDAWAGCFGNRDPSFGRIRFRHGYWRGSFAEEGRSTDMVVFADRGGPSALQRQQVDMARARYSEFHLLALERLLLRKQLGYDSAEQLSENTVLNQVHFQPGTSPSDWGLVFHVNHRNAGAGHWIADVDFVGDRIGSVGVRRD